MMTFKMKQKLSITLDEKTIKMVEEAIKEGLYRNKSHVVEFSLTKVLNNLNKVERRSK